MIEYQYKQNGAGDIYRKHNQKVEFFFRGRWCRSIIPYVWEYAVLNPISKETAAKIELGVRTHD